MDPFKLLAMMAVYGTGLSAHVSAADATGASGLADGVVVIVSALCFAAAIFSFSQYLFLRRRVSTLAEAARSAAREVDPASAQTRDRDDIAATMAALRTLDAAASRLAHARDEEIKRRHDAEDSLRESEERYALAVRGANDGMWEWDLRANAVYYSPRWKSMLGYDDTDIGPGLEEWIGRVHPDDRDRVQAALDAHLAGQATRFDVEHRVRQVDGSYRWILARAATICNAAGRPYRMVGLHTDITARHQAQDTLIHLADALSGLRGDEFFRALVKSLVGVLNAREAFVAECADYPTTHVRMLAHWNYGGFTACPEFELSGTSCERVINEGKALYIPRDLGSSFPLEKEYDREAYLGLPCIDSEGRVIGHIACADGKPMAEELPHYAILKLFSVRAALELERKQVGPPPAVTPATIMLH